MIRLPPVTSLCIEFRRVPFPCLYFVIYGEMTAGSKLGVSEEEDEGTVHS
jgi:hypothetical protein